MFERIPATFNPKVIPMRKKLFSMRALSVCSILFFLVTPVLFAQAFPDESKPTLAVLPLRTGDNEITPETTELSNWIIFKSFTLGIKGIMDFAETQSILESNGAGGTMSCNTDSCVYRAGTLLDVERIIWGTLESDTNQHTIALYLVDVISEEALSKVTIQIKGSARDIQSHLTPALQRLYAKADAEDIASGNTAAPSSEDNPLDEPAAPFSRTVTLKLLSEPSGATVFINDEEAGTTPFHTDSLKAGYHRIKLRMHGYNEFEKTFTFSRGAKKKYLIKLSKNFGSLAVFSKPKGASVILNSGTLGQTPFFCDTPLHRGTIPSTVCCRNLSPTPDRLP